MKRRRTISRQEVFDRALSTPLTAEHGAAVRLESLGRVLIANAALTSEIMYSEHSPRSVDQTPLTSLLYIPKDDAIRAQYTHFPFNKERPFERKERLYCRLLGKTSLYMGIRTQEKTEEAEDFRAVIFSSEGEDRYIEIASGMRIDNVGDSSSATKLTEDILSLLETTEVILPTPTELLEYRRHLHAESSTTTSS